MDLLSRLIYQGLIVGAFYGFLVAGLNFLPVSQPLPAEFVDGVEYFFALIRGLDFILPVQSLLNVMLLAVSYVSVKYAMYLVLWIYSMVLKITV